MRPERIARHTEAFGYPLSRRAKRASRVQLVDTGAALDHGKRAAGLGAGRVLASGFPSRVSSVMIADAELHCDSPHSALRRGEVDVQLEGI